MAKNLKKYPETLFIKSVYDEEDKLYFARETIIEHFEDGEDALIIGEYKLVGLKSMKRSIVEVPILMQESKKKKNERPTR